MRKDNEYGSPITVQLLLIITVAPPLAWPVYTASGKGVSRFTCTDPAMHVEEYIIV